MTYTANEIARKIMAGEEGIDIVPDSMIEEVTTIINGQHEGCDEMQFKRGQ